MRKIITWILTLCLLCPLLGCAVFAEEQPLYLALGDSISAGYGLADPQAEGFVSHTASTLGMQAANHAVSGYTTADVLTRLSTGELDEMIGEATLITLTVGGNDLMNVFYGEVAAAYGEATKQSVTPEDIQNSLAGTGPELDLVTLLNCASTVLEGFAESETFDTALESFAENLLAILAYLRTLNPHCHIVVCNQYNPYGAFRETFYQMVYDGFEAGVAKLNAKITALSEEGEFHVAEVYEAFAAEEENLCNADATDLYAPKLDFHPNAKGHALLGETVAALVNSLPAPLPPTGDTSLLLWLALPLCLLGAVLKLKGMRMGAFA